MPRYSQELKNSTLRKMMSPSNRPISELSRETGIPEGTLHGWRKQARSNDYAHLVMDVRLKFGVLKTNSI